jgi:hypothetical protein
MLALIMRLIGNGEYDKKIYSHKLARSWLYILEMLQETIT